LAELQNENKLNHEVCRFVGYKRGEMWEVELPEKYGIEKGSLILPLWAYEGFYYTFAASPYRSQFFAVYKEGDWFDGRKNGQGKAGFGVAELLNEIVAPDPRHAVMLMRLPNNQGWQTYFADNQRIGAWMELHAITIEHDTSTKMLDIIQSENLVIDEEKIEKGIRGVLAQKNRLMMWLNNKK
jgi:hypothetical protein